jgi:maltose O-acetyltransferase
MGEMRERMLRGELYIADDPESRAEFGRAQELLARFNGSAPGAWDERDALLRRMLRRVGEGVLPDRHTRATPDRYASDRP